MGRDKERDGELGRIGGGEMLVSNVGWGDVLAPVVATVGIVVVLWVIDVIWGWVESKKMDKMNE